MEGRVAAITVNELLAGIEHVEVPLTGAAHRCCLYIPPLNLDLLTADE